MNPLLTPPPRAQRFLDDHRGAVAVLGIMIGAVLAAVLFHLMNCGFGILWREQAQDAADATAYEAAVWNARGMNTIVALNIFIALVMAVLIFWRVIIVFTIVALGLITIACPFEPEFCPMISPLAQGVQSEFKADPKIAGRVYQIIGMLHDAQKVVAAATPAMGTLSSVLEAKKYDATFGVGFGTQLLPTLKLPTGKKPNKSCRPAKTKYKTDAGSIGDLLGKPISLPVTEADDLHKLCEQGGKMQAVIMFAIVAKVGEKLHLDFLEKLGNQSGGGSWGKIWGTITGAGADFFCGDWTSLIDEVTDDNQNERCGNDKKCNEKANDSKKKNPKPNTSQVAKLHAEDVRWTRIWDAAANGNLFMQSWSYVKTERKYVQGLDRALRIADFVPGGTSNANPNPGDADGTYEVEEKGTTFAEAEMYFDCKSSWSDPSCGEAAPWTMAWRARLRRVHDPVDFIASDLQGLLVSALYGGLDGQFTGAVSSKFSEVTSALSKNGGRLIQIAPSGDFQAERDRLGRVLVAEESGSTGSYAVRSAAAWVADETAAGIPEMIH